MKVLMIDCGQASRKTMGTWFGFTMELATPPNHYQYHF